MSKKKAVPDAKPVNPWPFPVLSGNGGGEWEPPEGITDVGLLVPSQTQDHAALRKKDAELDLPVFVIPGLDGKYVLSSDGSTRPYGEGH